MTVDIREYTSSLTFATLALVLWVGAMLFGSNLLGLLSLFSGGWAVAAFMHARRRVLGDQAPNEVLESRIAGLEARLAEAEIENERLRAEAEFDRQLRSGDPRPGSTS